MIHIHVPSLQTFSDINDPFSKFTSFNIHINGAYHASVRYRVLNELHEKIVENFGLRLNIPEFPPKKMWRLDSKALNTRRLSLAKYLQALVQIPDISRHSMVERTFLDFQIKSFGAFVKHISLSKLEIFLPDGRSVVIDCHIGDSTNIVMERFSNYIGISEKNSQYFGMFLSRSRKNPGKRSPDDTFDQICIRWLKNFESPYISQKLANRAYSSVEDDFQRCFPITSLGSTSINSQQSDAVYHRILVHRVIWDPSVEESLLDDQGSLKMIYLQAVNDIQRGMIPISKEIETKLCELQAGNNHKQFMRLCHQQSDYGYEYLDTVVSNFPGEGTLCELKLGRRQVVLEHIDDGKVIQSILRCTRIKVWRMSSLADATLSDSLGPEPFQQMTFEIEYSVGNDDFNKIILQTNQVLFVKFSHNIELIL